MKIKDYEIKPRSDLRAADLRATDLSGANLSGANLRWAKLPFEIDSKTVWE